MTRLLSALALAAATSFAAGCGPSRLYTNEDVPTINKLDDLMWAQAQAADPGFKLIGKTAFTDDEYAVLAKAGDRLKVTAPRLKMSFSKGAEWDAFSDSLGAHADELSSAVAAKDPAKAATAIAAAKDSCKGCHKKYK